MGRQEKRRYLQRRGLRSRHRETAHLETRAEGEGLLSRALVAAASWPQFLQALLDPDAMAMDI